MVGPAGCEEWRRTTGRTSTAHSSREVTIPRVPRVAGASLQRGACHGVQDRDGSQ